MHNFENGHDGIEESEYSEINQRNGFCWLLKEHFLGIIVVVVFTFTLWCMRERERERERERLGFPFNQDMKSCRERRGEKERDREERLGIFLRCRLGTKRVGYGGCFKEELFM
ncbi:hypothetical protein CIPAW_08G006200 [Carya illinoinensis]|uniref:Transmembrane protein n=1 Tax=Carya illinoinensis TaxID=32201 RepID=A0A8T1PLE7_CARIL|nr:hypothetical protein CIPAW_08G006200 [Carya illinoinensis]